MSIDRSTNDTLDNLRHLSKAIQDMGCIAGGAIRDYILGRQPKDYDIFLFNVVDNDSFYDVVSEICRNLEIPHRGSYDQDLRCLMLNGEHKVYHAIQQPCPCIDGWSDYDSKDFIYPATVSHQGLQIQFIARKCTADSSIDIVHGFDFTVNMGAYTNQGLMVSEEMRQAIDSQIIRFNRGSVNLSLPDLAKLKDRLATRGRYLADKTGFKFDIQHMQDLFEEL